MLIINHLSVLTARLEAIEVHFASASSVFDPSSSSTSSPILRKITPTTFLAMGASPPRPLWHPPCPW